MPTHIGPNHRLSAALAWCSHRSVTLDLEAIAAGRRLRQPEAPGSPQAELVKTVDPLPLTALIIIPE